jgi:hypothetical protein
MPGGLPLPLLLLVVVVVADTAAGTALRSRPAASAAAMACMSAAACSAWVTFRMIVLLNTCRRRNVSRQHKVIVRGPEVTYGWQEAWPQHVTAHLEREDPKWLLHLHTDLLQGWRRSRAQPGGLGWSTTRPQTWWPPGSLTRPRNLQDTTPHSPPRCPAGRRPHHRQSAPSATPRSQLCRRAGPSA